VVGLGIIHFWAWNKMAWIWDLWVDQSERGKGYGTEVKDTVPPCLKGCSKQPKGAGQGS
jgi:hypothetical protein